MSPGDFSQFSFRTKEYTGSDYDPVLSIDYEFVSVESASLGGIKAVFK